MIDRKVMQQVLEALEYENSWHKPRNEKPYASTLDAITALRAALAEPVPEPKPMELPSEDKARQAFWGCYPDSGNADMSDVWMTCYRWCRAIVAAPQQQAEPEPEPEPEPVAVGYLLSPKLPPIPSDILVGDSQLAILWKISSYARLAVEQNTAALKAECDALRAVNERMLKATPPARRPLTDAELHKVLYCVAKGIEDPSIVMSHWPLVFRAAERAHGITGGNDE